jgi:hypothetical protein
MIELLLVGLESLVEWCNDNQGFALVALTTCYVFATFALVYLTYVSIRSLHKLEKERVRPFVYCEFSIKDPWINFVIVNGGMTLAKNVELSFDPPLFHLQNLSGLNSGTDQYTKEDIEFFKHIGSLSPGRKLDTFIGYAHNFEHEYPTCKLECTMSYESIFGTCYKEKITLDLSYAKSKRLVPETTEQILKRIVTSLEKLVSKIKP